MAKVDIKVKELVERVNRGDLVLPEMQRRYVWPATRVRDLLDSLYRGYPSGTILVWESGDNVKTRKLSVGKESTGVNKHSLLLLDGQQRITSLAAVLSGEPIIVRDRKRPIEILFNLEHPDGPPVEVMEVDEEDISVDYEQLEDEEDAKRDINEELKKRAFVVSSTKLKNNPIWVNVSDIFTKSERELLQPIGINSDDERWEKYSQRIRNVREIENYDYVMHVLNDSMAYEEVTEIFVRVNSLGAKLRSSDLALAQITSKWRGFTDELEDFSKEFNDDSEYIEQWVALRALVVYATKQSKFKTIGRQNKAKLESSWSQSKEGVLYAYNFVKNNAGIQSLDHLSASLLLMPIAVYSTLKDGKLSEKEVKQLLKWFYYAHMRGHYGMGSSESILNNDLNVLFRKQSLGDLTNTLFEHVKRFEVTQTDLTGKNQRSPFFTLLYTFFVLDNVKDWQTGIKLSESSTGQRHTIQYHHIFPKSLLQKYGYEDKMVNELSNFAFISGRTNRNISNKKPSDYLTEIAKNDKKLLTDQLVPTDKELWKIENYPNFLEYRRKALADHINKFMSKFE